MTISETVQYMLDDGTLALKVPSQLVAACVTEKSLPVPHGGWTYRPPSGQTNPVFGVLNGEPVEPNWKYNWTPVSVHPHGKRLIVPIADLHPQHPECGEAFSPHPPWALMGRLGVFGDGLDLYQGPSLAPYCRVPHCRAFGWYEGLCGWHLLEPDGSPSWPELVYVYQPYRIEHQLERALCGVSVTPPFTFLLEVKFTRRGLSGAVRLEHICYT